MTNQAKKHAAHRPKTAGRWIAQVTGEILITLGLLILLFIAWQLWWTNIDANRAQAETVESLAQEFQAAEPGPTGHNTQAAENTAATPTEPPVSQQPDRGEAFGIVYIPRLGENYRRPTAEGTTQDVLDNLGLGHYEGTALPGDIGNFALAGHRQTNGAVLDYIDKIENGDHIYVQTKDGYYTYTVYESKIVLPTDVYVIAPNPDDTSAEATERLLTLTTCHPRFGDTERYIVHATLESWQPLSAGAPQEIATAANT